MTIIQPIRVVNRSVKSLRYIDFYTLSAQSNAIAASKQLAMRVVATGVVVDAIGAQAQADIVELWRRIAFSILITNIDDHLLNHGFLHETRDQWRLAPAFDINPFPDRVRQLKTWISEEAGPVATVGQADL
jgi:HipA-like C-terminal domain